MIHNTRLHPIHRRHMHMRRIEYNSLKHLKLLEVVVDRFPGKLAFISM